MWSSALPEEIAAIRLQIRRCLQPALSATAETLRTISADPKHLGADIGFFAVLHTWGQNLMHHSAPALCRAGRRTLPGQATLDPLPARLLSCPSGSSLLALLSPLLPANARACFQ